MWMPQEGSDPTLREKKKALTQWRWHSRLFVFGEGHSFYENWCAFDPLQIF